MVLVFPETLKFTQKEIGFPHTLPKALKHFCKGILHSWFACPVMFLKISFCFFFLSGNDINKLEGLEGLRNLVELVLDANKVKTISPFSFAHLYNLTELHLEENRLVSLAGLDPLSKLERLYLGSNKIQASNFTITYLLIYLSTTTLIECLF